MLLVQCNILVVLAQMRKTRTLTELIVEAEDVISNPVKNMKVSTAQSSFRYDVNKKFLCTRLYFKYM